MKKIFIIVIASLLLNGCVRYYKTSKVRKSYNKAVSSTNKIKNKTNGNYLKNKKIYDSIVVHVEDKNMKPYPVLRTHLKRMKASIDKLIMTSNAIVKNRDRFNKVVGKNKKIKSNKPVWKKFQKVKDEFEKNISILRKDVKSYEKASRAFTGTANRYKISRVNAVKIKNKIGKFSSRVVVVLNDTRLKIKKTKVELKKLERKGYNIKVIDEKRLILSKMGKILDKINVKNSEIVKLNSEFEKEAGNRKIFWAGPGMITHTLLSNMSKKGNEVKVLGNKFSALTKKFNKK